MKCNIVLPYCDKEATWQGTWTTSGNSQIAYFCDEHFVSKAQNSPYWSNPTYLRLTEDDFWKELYDQGEDRLES